MSAVLQICAFLLLCAVLAQHYDEELVQTLPVASALLILLLCVLSYLRLLAAMDLISAAVILLCAVVLARRLRRETPGKLARLLLSPRMLTLFVMLAIAWIFLEKLQVSNRDDYGCWAVEAKSVCFYGGFAPRYQNAAVSFGTYFPAATLFRCWLCLMFKGVFHEGLLAVGSAWLAILLLAPMLSEFSFRAFFAPAAAVLAFAFVLFLPGVVDCMTYLSVCAEPLMSAAFTGLWIVLLRPERRIARAQLLAYGLLLGFFKASGILYLLSVTVFLLLNAKTAGEGRMLASLERGEIVRGTLLCLVPPAVWLLFCRMMARTDYFSVTAAGGEAGRWSGYLKSLLLSLVAVPAHQAPDGILDLPLLAVVALIALLWLAAARRGLVESALSKRLGIYYAGMLALFFPTVFLLHSLVFRESLYLDPEAMIISVSRYGQPLFLAPILILLRQIAARRKRRQTVLAFGTLLGMVLLCTCFWTVWYRILNSAQSVRQAEGMKAYVTEKCDPFLKQTAERPVGRVLFVYGEDFDLQDTARTCLQFLAAPDSVVLCEVNGKAELRDREAGRVAALAKSSHADYVYFVSLDREFLRALDIGAPPEEKELLPLNRP